MDTAPKLWEMKESGGKAAGMKPAAAPRGS